MNEIHGSSSRSLPSDASGRDPIEDRLRTNARAVIEAACLAGTKTRRVKRMLSGLLDCAVSRY